MHGSYSFGVSGLETGETFQRDRHVRTILLAGLVCLWGAISLPLVPWHPFAAPNIAQAIAGGAAFIYLMRTRHRPRVRFARIFTAAVIVYAIILLPWTAVQWCELGRPLEALTAPQIAAVATPLIIPRPPVLSVALVLIFVAEGMFAYFYAAAVGLGDLLPLGEPLITGFFAVLGVALVVLAEQRRRLTKRYIQVQSELVALRRVGPMFEEVRQSMTDQLDSIGLALNQHYADGRSRLAETTADRALERLNNVGAQIGVLTDVQVGSAEPYDEEQQFLARDAHNGAIVFAAALAFLSIQTAVFGAPLPADLFVASAVVSLSLLAYLVATRKRPSRRSADWILFVLWVALIAVTIATQRLLLDVGRPFIPFLGQKIFVVVLALVAASRFWFGLSLIVFTTLSVFVAYYAFEMGANEAYISMIEPWVILIYAIIAGVTLVLREQRLVRSLRLRQAESESTALHRRADLLFALRDQFNTPLQALVLREQQLAQRCSPAMAERLHTAISQLIVLSRQLVTFDLPSVDVPVASFDGQVQLRARV